MHDARALAYYTHSVDGLCIFSAGIYMPGRRRRRYYYFHLQLCIAIEPSAIDHISLLPVQFSAIFSYSPLKRHVIRCTAAQ